MKEKIILLSQRYVAALGRHLKQGPLASLKPALGLGRQTVAIGLETLDLARIHEQALVVLILPTLSSRVRVTMIKRAGGFFTEANIPIEETHSAARESKVQLSRLKETLCRRTVELAASNRRLQRGITLRKSVEAALRKNGEHYSRLLKESLQLQEGLRHLTRRLITAQEDERKNISHELQDEIAQTLLGDQRPAALIETRGPG